MVIKMKCYVSGPRYTYKTGQVVDHPDEKEARRWIAVGVADAIEAPAAIETAAQMPAPERAVTRRRRSMPH